MYVREQYKNYSIVLIIIMHKFEIIMKKISGTVLAFNNKLSTYAMDA